MAMIYLKSALAGIITAVLVVVICGISTYSYAQARLWMLANQSPGDTYFEVIHINILSREVLTAMTALFLAGAYWMFRRLRTQQSE